MPEGHTIRTKVVEQAPHLVGCRLSASSPNGRFRSGAAAIDGRTLESMDAWGKHLFYFFEGRRVLHVHLGMDGRFRHHRLSPDRVAPPPRSVGMRVAGPEFAFDLSTPKVCQVIDEVHQRRIVAALGPDPLRADADRSAAVDRLRSYDGPAGAALLDQSVVAGIGNVYRAEILFALRIHPERPAGSVSPEEWSLVWDTAARMLEAGVLGGGRIITVDRRDVKVRDRRRTYVYGQKMCARCGSAVRKWDLLGREAWACETCQPKSWG